MRGLWHRYGLYTAIVFSLGPWALAAAPRPTDVVAEVDSFRITVADVQKKLAALRENQPEKRLEVLRRMALDELVNDRLLNLKARTIPLEDDSAFLERTNYSLAQFITRQLYQRVVVSVISVSDSEIAERYERNPNAYRFQPWAHAQHILIAPVQDTLLLTPLQRQTGWWAETEEKAQKIADSLYRMLEGGAVFDSLARRWSQDMASGVKGGDLGIFYPGQMVSEFDSVAFNLPVRTVSAPFKTQFGYHIVRVKARQKVEPAPFSDSLKQVIRQQLESEKLVARSRVFLDSLMEAARLEFNPEVLELPDSVLNARPIWAAATAYGDTIRSGRLAAQMAALQPTTPPGRFSKEEKKGLLRELATPFIMRRAAEYLGVTTGDSVQAKREQLYQNERLERLRRQAVLDYTPTEEEVRSYYLEHRTELSSAESLSVRVQQIVFKTKVEAEQVFRELTAGADFALLARKYFPGDSDIAREAFDLGFISPPAMPERFFSVAETLAIGAVSRPFRTEWGYHLIRVVERRPDLSFDAARRKIIAAIRKTKQEEHKRKWEASLREGHVVSVKERVLRGIKVESSSSGVSSRP